LLPSLSTGWFGAAFDQNTPAVLTGNRIQTCKLSVRIGCRNLARFKFDVLKVPGVPKKGLAFFATGTEQGCRTATAVSKAVTNQHILPAGKDMIPYGMDSFPVNGSTFKAPSVAQRTDAVIIQICIYRIPRWCLTAAAKFRRGWATFFFRPRYIQR
jgi:hypothetical protein